MLPAAEDPIRFASKGYGLLTGVDNGRPDSHESYKSNTRRALDGMAVAIMQSNGRPGVIELSAEARGLAADRIRIEPV